MIAEEYDAIVPDKLEFPIVTAPTISGCEIKKVLGIVTGLTARTRGMGGQIAAGIQSMFGGEVSAFTMEIEKARIQALNRMIKKARDLGANAIISLDMESSDLVGTILISATGTAGVVEPE
ncbi:MAG: YbjQ family protein [Candidatus Bathyarchaeota archaeon]|nr:YbjQ family protein [Candidatus Bathyarchaeota archaeon]